jgi:hypothetical protein
VTEEITQTSAGDSQHPLRKKADEIAALFVSRAERFRNASLFAKIALVSIGSALAAIAQFTQFPPGGPTGWQVAGIGASLIVAVGGIFVWITEQDAPKELSVAHAAVEKAREALAGYEELYQLTDEMDRLVYLVQATNLMRGVIERAAGSGLDEDKLAALILKACDRSLPIAMGFQQADQWTIGIYKAVPLKDGRHELACIASKRAIECDISEARRWREGTGIAGVCFSINDEVVIPDLQAQGVRSVFGSSANEVRQYDTERYRSMVAAPINVGKDDHPWGVIAATNDRIDHFTATALNGLSNHEGARSLAGMVALGVALSRIGMNQPAAEGFPTSK